MDSYIVRIYRRRARSRRAVVGLVEDVRRKDRRTFTDRDGLWRILTEPAGGAKRRKRLLVASRRM